MDAQILIEKLQLESHPEGGYFKETYRSEGIIPADALPGFDGDRNYATAIYFLLLDDNFSAFHRIKSDETWHFYTGTPIVVTEIGTDGTLMETTLGADIADGQVFQYTVKAGHYFASEVLGRQGFALVGCTVAPGFDFRDFDMPDRQHLTDAFPHLRETIERLTR